MTTIQRLQFFDLLYEVGLLIIELFVLVAVVVELAQKVNKLVTITQQDVEYRPRLVRVGNEYLQHHPELHFGR